MGRWKNTGWSRLKTRIKFISFFNSGHFFWETVYGLQHQFSNFCSWFSAFRRNDFGVEPVPSLQASGKLFWGVGNNFGCPKTQLAMFAWTWIFLPKNRNMADDIRCHRPSAGRHDSGNPDILSLFCRMSECIRSHKYPSARQVRGVLLHPAIG